MEAAGAITGNIESDMNSTLVGLADLTTNATTSLAVEGCVDHIVIAFMVFNLLQALLVSAGNAIVIFAFARWQKLQTIRNAYLTSLATSNVILGMSAFVNNLINLSGRPQRCFSVSLSLPAIFMSGNAFCSILNVLAVTIERFIILSYPLRYMTLASATTTTAGLSAIWVSSVGYTVYMYFNTTLQLSSIPAFPAPLLVLLAALVIYIKLVCVVRDHRRRISDLYGSGVPQRVRDTRGLKMLGLILLTLITSMTLPWFRLVAGLATGGKLSAQGARLLSTVLTRIIWTVFLLGPCLHPYIYHMTDPDFNTAFRGILKRNHVMPSLQP